MPDAPLDEDQQALAGVVVEVVEGQGGSWKSKVLVATRITRSEMTWGMQNGGAELAERLAVAGIGQVSVLERRPIM